ncbi:MAG TPA: hypothetical protein PKK10_07180 [Woeseiaceae bacterium]|nr:hypothetical protein [Woeseiaceae bacterium]
MTFDRRVLFQLFKYVVYTLLTLNIFIFWREEFLASQLQFQGHVPWLDMIEAYASTIDTAAWVILLLMFELETYVLDEQHFLRSVPIALHGTRFVCIVFILYAFYGYLVNLLATYDVALLPYLTDLCSLTADHWSYNVDLDEYVTISAANCASFSDSSIFYQFSELPALVDAGGLVDIQRLAWIDTINALVWILIVVILEIDVRLQERGLLEGLALSIGKGLKVLLYSILFLCAVYWGIKGDFVDFWDAFLWLVAFFFIEMNVIDWRAEEQETYTEQTAWQD